MNVLLLLSLLTQYESSGMPVESPPLGTSAAVGNVDLDGYQLILDQDGDSKILNSRDLADDQIDIYINNAIDFKLRANSFDLNGSLITDTTDELHLGTLVQAPAGQAFVSGDVFVGGKLGVNGLTYFENSVIFPASTLLYFSGTQASDGRMLSQSTMNQWLFLPGSGLGRQIVISDASLSARDFDHVTQTNPTLYIHSAIDPDVDNTQYLQLTHDQTNVQLLSGTGDFLLTPEAATGKGAAIGLRENHEDLTFAADPGDATKVTTSLIPDGAFLVGITTRVTTTAVGGACTSVSIGDGTDPDLYGATTALTAGTTTDNTNWTAQIGNPQLAAGNVTITANGGNCWVGVWRVSATYFLPVAPTSN